ncbi:MAG TPA: hypothetical protein VIM79_27520 [Niastella sp.]
MLKKTLKIGIVLFLIANGSFAQWNGSATTAGDIYRDGNVGIGTTTPRALLSLGATSGGKKLLVYDNPSTNVQAGLGIDMSNTVGRELSIFHPTSDGVNGIISFGRILESNGSYSETMRLTGAGNLGIGTTNPRALLSLGATGYGKKLLVYDNPSTNVQAGFGIDMSNIGGGRELTVFHPSSNGIDGKISFGRILESTGAYTETVRITGEGNVGIGTTNPGSFKLAVEGAMAARSVKVTSSQFADYVFEPTYKLRPLSTVESYINENKHLPGMPSAKEIEKEGGFELAAMNVKLLEKIEELTLYVIEIKKENEQMKKENAQMKKAINDLKRKKN